MRTALCIVLAYFSESSLAYFAESSLAYFSESSLVIGGSGASVRVPIVLLVSG